MRAKVEQISEHHFQYKVRKFVGDVDTPFVGEAPKDLMGPNPKELLLSALCACTATDVVDLMKKFGVIYKAFSVEARADLTEQHPKVFSEIELIYHVDGAGAKAEMITEAVKRSTHQYSGIAAMLSKNSAIKYTVRVNGVILDSGNAEFTNPFRKS